METWGSWTFSKENESLLDQVLNEFATEQCSSDTPRKVVLSSLNASFKSRTEISSSSSDDCSDIDGDFNAVQTRFPKCCTVANEESVIIINDGPNEILPDTFDNELSFLSQRPVKGHENVTQVIVERLNTRDYNVHELSSLLKTELKNRNDVSEIIGELWPEMVTDEARRGLCEVLVKTDVKPQVICEQVYTPWFTICKSNLTGFIESLSKMIVHFPEYVCKSFLVELLKDKESILVKHVDWLVEIMKSLDQQYWCTLLSEYIKCCDVLENHQIPVLLHLVKNCKKGLNDDETERLVALCRNSVNEHSANRDYALFLMTVIGAIHLAKFRSEMTAICGRLQGASKFLIAKTLKDAK